MKKLRLICLMVLSAFTLAAPASSAPVPEALVALKAWKDAVESGKVENIMTLYDQNAIMISTFAQNPLTHDEIENYFKKIEANSGINVVIENVQTQMFSGMAINSGTYTLSYMQGGEKISIPVRFTFVYRFQGLGWFIVHQHSSRIPLPEEDK